MSVTVLLLLGFSSFNSGSGTFNLYSARTLPYATLNFNASAGGAIQEAGAYHHIAANPKFGFTYGIIDPLEIYIGATIYGKYGYGDGGFFGDDANSEFGWRNMYGGIKFCIPLTGSMDEMDQSFKWLVGGHVGTALNPFEPANNSSIIGDPHYFAATYKHRPDLAMDLLNDFEIYPLLVHINLGYVMKGDALETGSLLGFERTDNIRIGGGFEIAAGPFTRFVFETKNIRPQDGLQDTLIGTFGIRFVSPKMFSFDIAVDHVFNDLTDFVPDASFDGAGQWRYKIGFTLQSTIVEKRKKIEPKKGTIVLTVSDIATNEPLVATVSFADTSLVYQTGEDGKLTIEILPGTYNLKLSKEGYLSREAAITVKPLATVNINTVLRKEEKEEKGVFSGTVSSFREEIPLQSKIEFLGTEIKALVSDPVKGIFQGEVTAGTYNIRVSADGYLPETFPVEIIKGETTIKNVKLVKKLEKEEKIVLRGINFASGQAVIPPSEYPVLDQVVEVLKANKNVTVEIGGHTDAVGTETYNQGLSERRAQSVRNYLIQRGISASRLSARGYGEYQPVASNTTREGRSQNRRIEFTVLSTTAE
jgi:outer membrane protein OmpA-like peptidoglycan-associated protein